MYPSLLMFFARHNTIKRKKTRYGSFLWAIVATGCLSFMPLLRWPMTVGNEKHFFAVKAWETEKVILQWVRLTHDILYPLNAKLPYMHPQILLLCGDFKLIYYKIMLIWHMKWNTFFKNSPDVNTTCRLLWELSWFPVSNCVPLRLRWYDPR